MAGETLDAVASAIPQTAAAADTFNPSGLLQLVNNSLNGISSVISHVVSIFTHGGTSSLAWYFSILIFSIVVVWHLTTMILGEDGGKVLANIVRAGMTWTVIAALLLHWAPEEEGGEKTFACSILSAQSALVNAAASAAQLEMSKSNYLAVNAASNSSSNTTCGAPTTNIVGPVLSAYAQMASSVFEAAFPSEEGWAEKSYGSVINGAKWVVNVASGGVAFKDAVNPFSYALFKTLSIIVCLIAAIYIVYTMVKFIFIVLIGAVYTSIALTLGPILMPFVMMKHTEFLFRGFVSLLISGLLYSVIAVLMTTITLPILDVVVGQVAHAKVMGSDVFFGCIIIAVFCMLMNMLMSRADNVATVIAGGGPNAGGDLGSGAVGGLVQAAGKAAKAVTSKGTSLAKDAFKNKEAATKPSGGGKGAEAGGGKGALSAVGGIANMATAPGASQVVSAMAGARDKMLAARKATRGR